MVKKVLFVHGTGVRKAGYDASFAVISRQLAIHASEAIPVECLWGEKVGAKLNYDGASIPTYGETRGAGVSPAREMQAMWSLLLQDPSFELAMLSGPQAEAKAVPPNTAQSVQILLDNFVALRTSQDLEKELIAMALDGFWPRVQDDLIRTDGFRNARFSPSAGKPPHRLALARAVVASLIKASLEVGGPALNSSARDRLTITIAGLLGDDARGVFSVITAPLRGLAESIGTWHARRKRTSLTDTTYPAAGDILVYQAHGNKVRQFIRDSIGDMPGDDVFLFAHSLGSIASFELLVKQRPPNVKGLITFGSQAPFFYEIGGLETLGYEEPLPPHFPPWINFYDLNDPLSYVGSKLFEGRVSDYKIESGESFPASHSAYLHSRELWTQSAGFMAHA
jgi:pimeloyl-ACP methyl ester carboxylesterase